jgi:hypothetical protein
MEIHLVIRDAVPTLTIGDIHLILLPEVPTCDRQKKYDGEEKL